MSNTFTAGSRIIILLIIGFLFSASVIALSVCRKDPVAYKSSHLFNDSKKIEQKYLLQSGGKLIIDADVGSISVTGTEREEVAIVVYARGDEDDLERFDVKMEQSGNDVKIKALFSGNHFRWFNFSNLDILFEIEVPKQYNLDLETAGGNIEIKNIEGRIEGETSGGNLILEDLTADVILSTSGGNVEIRNASGDFRLETSGGNMFAQEVTGPLHMETSGGSIDIRDCDGKIYGSTSGGNIKAYVKSNQGINLSTSGGNIYVRLPSSITADVYAEASGGDVNCEMEFSGKLKDGSMKGKINGGGKEIQLETSGGNITITSYD